ncbi:hypothetical protein AB0B54_21560 [Microbispora bryophytorum]|uniref:hypothetical protein n=1 Tax=Microbispora bryophytorum TaxID=1460882 RepID=UPI0033C9074C
MAEHRTADTLSGQAPVIGVESPGVEPKALVDLLRIAGPPGREQQAHVESGRLHLVGQQVALAGDLRANRGPAVRARFDAWTPPRRTIPQPPEGPSVTTP